MLDQEYLAASDAPTEEIFARRLAHRDCPVPVLRKHDGGGHDAATRTTSVERLITHQLLSPPNKVGTSQALKP